MDSFNVYRQTSETIGGNTPVWLDTVKPIPVGAYINAMAGTVIPAGTAITYDAVSKEAFPLTDVAILDEANAFLYNDVYVEGNGTAPQATCAVVMHHPEGLLIERVYPEITEEQIAALQKAIPGVLLVRG